VTTHERELTELVDLCTGNGAALNPAARGWSRRPLHRANLDGAFGRNKRWDYWAVLAGDLVVSAVYSDLDTYGLADVYWADLATGAHGGKAIFVGKGVLELPDRPGTAPLAVGEDGLALSIFDDARGTHLSAAWREADGRRAYLDVTVEPAHESLNVVIPWSDDEFNFTSKHWARAATGTLIVGDDHRAIGPDAWGVLDVGRGRWPARISWNWGGGAGRVGNHVVGLQFGAKWTAGTGFTENGLLVDGVLHKVGRELDWEYDWDAPMKPWRVTDPGGQLDVVLTPRFDKRTDVDVNEDLGTEVHQAFGTWSGYCVTDEGERIEFDGMQGFAEEARQRW
jgi:hypothetical protein